MQYSKIYQTELLTISWYLFWLFVLPLSTGILFMLDLKIIVMSSLWIIGETGCLVVVVGRKNVWLQKCSARTIVLSVWGNVLATLCIILPMGYLFFPIKQAAPELADFISAWLIVSIIPFFIWLIIAWKISMRGVLMSES